MTKSITKDEIENGTTSSVTEPATPVTVAEKKKRGRKKKYETKEEAQKVAQEQRREYRERQKDKIEQKRLLRSMLDSIPTLKQRLVDANSAIYSLMKGEEANQPLYELPEDIYQDAFALLHPIKKRSSVATAPNDLLPSTQDQGTTPMEESKEES
jgi:hypothetical protein